MVISTRYLHYFYEYIINDNRVKLIYQQILVIPTILNKIQIT